MKLSLHQEQQALRVQALISRASGRQHSVVLVGGTGAGKRTAAKRTADLMGLAFRHVSLALPTSQLRALLFGAAETGDRSIAVPYRGELSRDEPVLIYLSHLERTDDALFRELHQLIDAREFIDAAGSRVVLSDDIYLVAGLSSPAENANVHADHFLTAAFQHRVDIELPSSREDLKVIVESMLDEAGAPRRVPPAALDLLAPGPSQGLTALRAWVEDAAFQSPDEDELGVSDLELALHADLRRVLQDMPFRGRVISTERLDAWLAQFPAELRSLAGELLRTTKRRYYIGSRAYYDSIEAFIASARLDARRTIWLCRWQDEGKSASDVAHKLRKQAGWRVSDLDLRDESTWPNDVEDGQEPVFVLVDDFIGTGGTLSGICEVPDGPLAKLLSCYPDCEAHLFIMAGFVDGLQSAVSKLGSRASRLKRHLSLPLYDSDRCFTEDSQVIPARSDRERLGEFCDAVGKEKMKFSNNRIRTGLCRGFHGLGALVVFHDDVPNNSLPLLWHDARDWIPLFPKSGLPDDDRLTTGSAEAS